MGKKSKRLRRKNKTDDEEQKEPQLSPDHQQAFDIFLATYRYEDFIAAFVRASLPGDWQGFVRESMQWIKDPCSWITAIPVLHAILGCLPEPRERIWRSFLPGGDMNKLPLLFASVCTNCFDIDPQWPRLIMESGGKSDIDFVDADGRNVVFYAALYGSPADLSLLMEAGANIKHVDYSGSTCLKYAILSCNVSNVDWVLQHLDVNKECARNGTMTALDCLLSWMVDPRAKVFWSSTAQSVLQRSIPMIAAYIRTRGGTLTSNSSDELLALAYLSQGDRARSRGINNASAFKWLPHLLLGESSTPPEDPHIDDRNCDCRCCLLRQSLLTQGANKSNIPMRDNFGNYSGHCGICLKMTKLVRLACCRMALCKDCILKHSPVLSECPRCHAYLPLDINPEWQSGRVTKMHLLGWSKLRSDYQAKYLEEPGIKRALLDNLDDNTVLKLLKQCPSVENPNLQYWSIEEQTFDVFESPKQGSSCIEIAIGEWPYLAFINSLNLYTVVSGSVADQFGWMRGQKLKRSQFINTATNEKIPQGTNFAFLEPFTIKIGAISITLKTAVVVDPAPYSFFGIQLGYDVLASGKCSFIDVESDVGFLRVLHNGLAFPLQDTTEEKFTYFGWGDQSVTLPLLHFSPFKGFSFGIGLRYADPQHCYASTKHFDLCHWCNRASPRAMRVCERCDEYGLKTTYCSITCQREARIIHKAVFETQFCTESQEHGKKEADKKSADFFQHEQ